MHLSILGGTTSKIVQVPVYDSSSTVGGMLTGLVFNTASLVCYYNREGAAGAATQISLLTATKGTWTTAGFVAVDGTNTPGWYELHVPNAAIASGAKSVIIQLRGATNMVPVNIIIELTATDNQDAVRGGMAALPNANAAAASGLPVLGTNATAISFTAGMTISNASGDALALTSSGSNGNALNAAGNGTGAGLKATAGATGNGLQVIGGATSGSAIKASGTAGNAIALELVGQGSAAALSATGGATGIGITAVGGGTSGSGMKCTGTAGNAIALEIVGQGSAAGIQSTGGATGSAFKLVGGGTSGHGLAVTTTSGDGFNLTPTAGNAITATANGTSKHGIVATGGTGGTSDGLKGAAGTGGVDIRGAITGDVTGALSGAVGSVTGAVGSVTARVTANTDQWAGTTIPAPAVTGVPKVDVVDIAGATVSTSSAQLGVNAVNIGGTAAASATIGTVTTATTATNLTNAPTSGDLTSTMKTSVENAVWDAARSSHVATGVFGQLGQHILRDNTATAGASGTITLDASASTTVDQYKGDVLYIYSGTGVGQSRVISAYSAGRVATVVPAWVTTPDNTSKFILTAQRTPIVGTDTRIITSADSITSGETIVAVTGAVGSVTGAVGSVTGAVGSVTGAVGSVTARVTANADQWAGTTIPAPAVTGVPKVDLVDIAGATVSTSSAQLGVNAVQIGAAVPGSATIGTVTTTTTATNLTNAPSSGDLTSTMKTSVENAVWDAARSSHLATGVFGQLGQQILRDNTATAGAASSITLDGTASTTVDLYKGDVLYIYSGTGSGQSRVISAYSAGRVATVVPNWVTTPDNTSKFILTVQRTPLVGTDSRVLTSADVSTSGETVAAVTGAVGSVTGAVGSVTGAVGSVSGAVGSVTGNVGGNVVGSVASVTARVTANADQWAGTTIPAPAVTGVPKVDLVDIAGSTVSTSSAQLGVNAVQIGASVPSSATIGTVTTTTTATNLTNAPTSGDFTATMKTSLNAATPQDTAGTTTLLSRLSSGRATNLDNLDATISGQGNPGGAVVTGTNSATTFKTDRTESATDYWKDVLLLLTSGAMVGQVKKVSAYNGTTKEVTLSTGFTATPADGVTFLLVDR